LDIRRGNVLDVIKGGMDLAAEKGCNAVELDKFGTTALLP
jgi:hypothetical protein